MKIFVDRIHRLPRIWSNRELNKFAHLFHGEVVNVSGWKDRDKEGRHYRDYFKNAKSYTITNFKTEARGFQGRRDELFLDLEADIPRELHRRFDVVFNHTTLEHIFRLNMAFRNLCDMSRDLVVIILPFMQPYHSDYGDYWRLTPLAVKRLFENNGFTVLYQSFNRHRMSSVYTFTIASRNPDEWQGHFDWSFSCRDPLYGGPEPYIGCRTIPNRGHRLKSYLRGLLKSTGFS